MGLRIYCRIGRTLVRGILAALLGSAALGQDVQDSKDRLIQDLLSRLKALEHEVSQLEASAPLPPEPADAAAQGSFADNFHLRAYADADYGRRVETGVPNRFFVGEIVLFGTGRISPKLTALVEAVVDTDGGPDISSVPFNIERLLLQYRANDYFNLETGIFRTAIGYYSTAYLRGAWFQTAIGRPRLFAFEEDGGLLPLHLAGVSASGRIPSGSLGLHYVAEAGNSRNWGVNEPIGGTGHSGVNLSLYVKPPAIPGLEAGFAVYRDQYSPFPGIRGPRSAVTAHVVYHANRIEFLNEGVVGQLHDTASNATGTLTGFYSQLGYRMGPDWGPYVRVEKIAVHVDPFFNALLPEVAWRSMYTGGVRYDWSDSVALKFEASHEVDWGRRPYLGLAAQIAFAF